MCIRDRFNRDEAGVMHPLPKPSVDTGMGLERISAVLQHVHANYEIDIFTTLIAAAARETKTADLSSPSLKVLADHIRACSFLIADGVIPGNEGRGYVLRRIIRRAIRHGYKLGARKAFFHNMVADLVGEMGGAYPELKTEQTRISNTLKLEEDRFFETIENGITILDENLLEINNRFIKSQDMKAIRDLIEPSTLKAIRDLTESPAIKAMRDLASPPALKAIRDLTESPAIKAMRDLANPPALKAMRELTESPAIKAMRELTESPAINAMRELTESPAIKAAKELADSLRFKLSGDLAFKLHDTYGFPLDLTADMCRENGFSVDTDSFDAAMARQKEQARAAGKFKMAANLEYKGAGTDFKGYETLETSAKVLALYKNSTSVSRMDEGDQGIVVLDITPFYAESGGQIGDSGVLKSDNGIFAVEDTQKIQASVFGHHGILKTGTLKVGDAVKTSVDMASRAATMRNHSATHLMHKALRETLGAHVQQKGSLVDTEKTRFDFVHNAPMTDAEIAKVEAIVNAEILANAACQARVMDIESAQKTGAMMLFGEKYGDEVRVLDIGTSRELCGGTHVSRTGDIGLFKITGESGVAAGVRRVEATTGHGALKLINAQQALITGLAAELKAPVGELANKVTQLSDHAKSLEKELARLKSKLASSQGDDLSAQAIEIAGVKVLAATLEGADANTLRETMDKLKDKLKSAAIVLASVNDGKVSLAAGVTNDLIAKLKAGDLVNHVASQVGGKGGGKPDMAMAGGTDAANLPKALASVNDWVTQKLN